VAELLWNSPSPNQETKGAMVFLPIEGRVFVLCFGHVAHNLTDESYEYDFGIKTTLSCFHPVLDALAGKVSC
jgi:uncharacterized protein (TIGR04141 family)